MSVKMGHVLAGILALLLLLPGRGGVEALSASRDAPTEAQEPTISLISASNPTCYRPALQSNTCIVRWGAIDVSTASPRTVISMTLSVDGRVRAVYQGFFQSTMHVSPSFHQTGFQMTCGPAGVAGLPDRGHVYAWTLRAQDSAGDETTSAGSVTCPSLDPLHTFLPLIQHRY
jgi:hypothetical protein